ncbi:MAG: hypothetical protein M1818_007361 [Claussenomyces sp. TS43310]|nr:MAG: hypothetical protein M1818_007361 [Claussenomyces sp. TS43310]
MANPAEYPDFLSGDVLITALAGVHWRLHSSALRNASKKLDQLLYSAGSGATTRGAKAVDSGIKWRFRMLEEEDGRVHFEAAERLGKNQFTMPQNVNGIGGREPHYLKAYDNYFRAVYNLDPIFATTDIKYLLADALSLLNVAESLNGENCVRRVIESYLLREGNCLWKHIASRPEAWSDMAVRLQSPTLFREAMCHIVGAWKLSIKETFLFALTNGPVIVRLAKRKVQQLDRKKQTMEEDLMHFYPHSLIHRADPVTGRMPGRHNYASDIYLWLALILVRQYISTAMFRDQHHRATDGGACLYRQISQGNAAYLIGSDLNGFWAEFEMSDRGKEALEFAVQYVKDQLRPFVSELLVDNTRAALSADAPVFTYLTCCSITDEELPWSAASLAEGNEDSCLNVEATD